MRALRLSVVLAIALAGLLAAPALADVVKLKDGSSREGRIVKEDKNEVVLEISQGRLKAEIILKRSEIESIERGRTANEKLLDEVAARRAKLKANDAAGWLAFAQWLDRRNGFSKDAREAYQKVIAIDGNNEAARRRLGYRKVGGQWLTRDEIMLAKGYLKHGEKWVTPEEKARLDAAARKKLENIKIALADEVRKQQKDKVDADARARQLWLRDMQQLAEQRGARYQTGGIYAAPASGGVVQGPYGWGYYGVRTSTGEYLPYVRSSPGVVYYTTGTSLGVYPHVSTHHRRYVQTPLNWGVTYSDKRWNVGLGSGGTVIRYTKKK